MTSLVMSYYDLIGAKDVGKSTWANNFKISKLYLTSGFQILRLVTRREFTDGKIIIVTIIFITYSVTHYPNG